MKLKTLFISLVFLAAATMNYAQESTFKKEVTAWHKKAVITCGMIKSPEALTKNNQIAKNLEEMVSELDALTNKYKTNPPAEYKNDPLWASYFEDLADNLTVVNYFTKNQQFRVASKTCSVFCQTILRMHKNNGTIEVSDMLFSLNMQLKLTTDISNTGNANGARNTLEMVKDIMQHLSQKIKGSTDKTMEAMYAPVETVTQNWLNAIEKGDAKLAKELYASFLPQFQKMFMASM